MKTIPQEIIFDINRIVEIHSKKTDFENRDELSGMGFGVAKFCLRHFPAGTEEYYYIYNLLFSQLSAIHKRAIKGVKTYKVILYYKTSKGKSYLEFNTDDRTEDEARKRAEQKKIWGSGKNPLQRQIISIEVTELQ